MSPRSAVRSPLTRRQRLRVVGNLVNLSTPVGLLVARLGRARVQPGEHGLLLGEGYRLRFPAAGAFTIGDVVTTSSTFAQLRTRYPDLLRHEERHSWQYVCCLGLPYFGLYGLAMAWSVLRTGDRASANIFERHAGLAAGGYQERPARPLLPVLLALVRPGRRDAGGPGTAA